MKKITLTSDRVEKLSEIEKNISYKFKDITQLDRALTHSSYRKQPDYIATYRSINECMEFLGDAILDFVISEHLYNTYNTWNEGMLSKFGAKVVCEQSLVIIANKLGLWKYILVGRGEYNGDKMNPAIMADAVEALFAAVYIDGGIENAKKVILNLLMPNIDDIINKKILRDYKTELQEIIQGLHVAPATYNIVSQEGPQHNSVFTVEVTVDGRVMGKGRGKSKKEAEQIAAERAIEEILRK